MPGVTEKTSGTVQAAQPVAAPTQAVQTDEKAPNGGNTTAKQSYSARAEQTPTPVYLPGNSGVLWRIQLGAFTREENALRLVVQLRKIGFDPAYERTEKAVRVVLTGIQSPDLEKVKSVLAEHSFNDYVIRQESW